MEAASAGPRPDALDRLEGDLTPVGALRAGNGDGSLPAWDGGLIEPPEGFRPGELHLDPFAEDIPILRIDASNIAEHKDLLSAGQMAMMAAYPNSFFLSVYPTRRSAAFPQRIYAMTRSNGASGRLADHGEGVLNVAEGFPFPFPETARELMWNHKLKYKGLGSRRHLNLIAPTPAGDYQPVRLYIETSSLYHQPGATLESIDNRLLFLLQTIESPARLAGTLLLVHESVNQAIQPRTAWTYNPSQRRVIRAPNVAYDHPAAAADGLTLSDMADMFNGAMDRYDWEMLGRKEMYVPYNAYRGHRVDGRYENLVLPGHLNPEFMRYERHRVWVVEARLKPGQRHVHPRRTYYLDEDSYQILMAEHYDGRGQLWRYSEAHPVVFYEVPTLWTTMETHHDIQSRRYVSYRQDHTNGVARFDLEFKPGDFSPQALRRKARR
jgi:hypothetical protein